MKASAAAQTCRARSPETWPTQVTRDDSPSAATWSRNGPERPVVVAGEQQVQVGVVARCSRAIASASRSSPFLTCSRPKNSRTNLPASSGNSASRRAAVGQVVERFEVDAVGHEADRGPGRERPQVADLGPREGVQAGGAAQVLPLDQRGVELLLPGLVPQRPGLGHAVRRDQVGDAHGPRRPRAPSGVPLPEAVHVDDLGVADDGLQVGLRPPEREAGRDRRRARAARASA